MADAVCVPSASEGSVTVAAVPSAAVRADRAPAPAAEPAGAGEESGSVRVRLDLAYDGTAFHGWAAQPGLRTVEGELTAALETVLRVPTRLTVAGRTDTGVHAAHQVAHADVPRDAWERLPGRSARTSEEALRTRLAGVLARRCQDAGVAGCPRGSADVVIHAVSVAPPGFDARFSAAARRYCYRVDDAAEPGVRMPWRRTGVLWLPGAGAGLDVEAMDRAVAATLGEHDFLSFCRPREGATTVRRILQAGWSRQGDGPDAGLVTFSVVADAFCHSMVRSLVGASLAVGQGRRGEEWLGELVARPSRTDAAPVAPPHGLTLEEVSYPEDSQLAAAARAARVVRTLGGGSVAAAPQGAGACCE